MAKRSLAIYGGVLDELVEFSRPHQDRTSIREANQFFVTSFFNGKEKAEAAKPAQMAPAGAEAVPAAQRPAAGAA